MANLHTVTIQTNGEYENLATLAEENSYTSSNKISSDSAYVANIGVSRNGSSGALSGIIYIPDCYIKLDDKITKLV